MLDTLYETTSIHQWHTLLNLLSPSEQIKELPAIQRALVLETIKKQLLYEFLTFARSMNPEFVEIIEKARADIKAGKNLRSSWL